MLKRLFLLVSGLGALLVAGAGCGTVATPGRGPLASGASAAVTPEVPVLDAALGYRRPKGVDVLVLRNGQQVTGLVLNPSFRLQTVYGSPEIAARWVAGMDLMNAPHGIQTVITVDRGRLSGFLELPAFRVRTREGVEQSYRRDEVSMVIFGQRENELAGLLPAAFLLIRNGDFFPANLEEDRLMLKVGMQELGVAVGSTQEILFGQGKEPTRMILMDGSPLQGTLEGRDVVLYLPTVGALPVYGGQLAALYLDAGKRARVADTVRLPLRAAAKGAAAARADAVPAKPAAEASDFVPEDETETEGTPPVPAPAPVTSTPAPAMGADLPIAVPVNQLSGPVVVDFEACPAEIGSFYRGVTFSPDWKVVQPANPSFRIRGKGAMADGPARLEFGAPLRRFEGIMTSPQSPTRILGRDASGKVVAEAQVYGVAESFSLKAPAGIQSVEIVGGRDLWTHDDLSF